MQAEIPSTSRRTNTNSPDCSSGVAPWREMPSLPLVPKLTRAEARMVVMAQSQEHNMQSLPPWWEALLRDSERDVATMRAVAAWRAREREIEKATRDAETLAREFDAIHRAATASLRTFESTTAAARAFFCPTEEEETIICTLMEHGWVPDMDLTLGQLRVWAEALDPENPELVRQATDATCASFRDRLDDIEAKLVSEFPSRSAILREAFDAHRQGKFTLSVPAFLTQVDGFFYDRCGESLFQGKDREALSKRVASMPNDLRGMYLGALLNPHLPLLLSEKHRPDDFSGLNRHQVLHGEVTDYGTKENSLKAVALLYYCAFVLPEQPTGQ